MYKSKTILALVLLFAAAGWLSACGNQAGTGEQTNQVSTKASSEASQEASSKEQQSSAYPMTITDELGHEVKIPSKPVRVFAPTLEDSLLVLGITPTMQWSNGVEPQLYLQDRLGSVPQIGFANGLSSFEAVLAQKPDLIILHNSFYAENGAYEKYSKIAPTYVFKNASANLNSTIATLGQLLNVGNAAEKALQQYADKAESSKAKLARLAEGKKAAIIRFNAKGMFFMNADYYSGYVLAHNLGFEQSGLVKNGAFEVSLEALPQLDADYIFLVNDGSQGDAFLKELKESEIWKAVPAVRAGHVYETASDYWLSGGFIAQGKVIDDIVRFLAP